MTPPPEELVERGESHHAYIQHYEMRPAFGGAPWTGRPTSTVGGWIRMREPRALDLPLLAALTDTWMPAMWPRLTVPTGKMTVDLTIHFRGAVPVDDLGWWFIRQTTRHVEDGFADEDCEVWASDGRLLAQSRQLCLLSR
jgi:acyl-CoA thioesterase